MDVDACEKIVKKFYEVNLSKDYIHYHNKKLIVNNENFRILPDDRFDYERNIILIEYENTKRPVESISKYWWLFKNTKWLQQSYNLKLFFIGLNIAHKGIRDESVKILGSELQNLFPVKFTFEYLPYDLVSKDNIIKGLSKILK